MVYNILNGDSLAYSFPDAKIEGNIIVIREGLIDGELSGDNLHDFWQSRTNYMKITEAEYNNSVVKEFEKIIHTPDNSEFNLWFEYDLFCQVNMWFVISIINSLPIKKKVFAVYTSYLDKASKQFWNGFGPANSEELKVCYANRISLSETDIIFGQELWKAYKNGNLEELTNLSKNQSLAFPYLQEVVKAHVDRFPKDGTKGRPEKVIEDITQTISTDFHEVFKEFWNRESIYGFGDSQLKNLYDKVMHDRLPKEVLSFDHSDPERFTAQSIFKKEIEQLLIQEKVPALGLGIIENGRLKKINVFGNADRDIPASYNSIFKIGSLTKPVTALVTLKLISQGKLELDEPLYKYWTDPDVKNDKQNEKLTPRIILSHRSGFANWRNLNDNKKLSFEFEPGTKFQYSGEGFQYLKKALEAKFDKKLEELADSLVFKPAKMNDTHFWWNKLMDENRYVKNYDKDGRAFVTIKYYKANAASNLLTTVEDYGNFLSYVLNGADLSQSVFEEMTKNQVQLKDNYYFGLGWEKLTGFSKGEYALMHTGTDAGVNTLAVIFPKSKNGYLIFLNGDNAGKIFEELLTKYMYLGNELWHKK